MFVDASAMLAILLEEPDAERFARILDEREDCVTSPVTVFEAVVGFMRSKQDPMHRAEERIRIFLTKSGIQIVPVIAEMGTTALRAFDKYGKGRGHKAQLNMGDCFAYACAKSLGVPLLYKGNDFARTDLA